MVFNLLFFRVTLERNTQTPEEQLALWKQEQYLNEAAEWHKIQAAQYPDFVSRI